MAAYMKKKHLIMDDLAIPPLFAGEIDNSDYIPDKEVIKESIEKNRMAIASFGDEFKHLLENKE